MSEALPEPLVSAEVDLRDFGFMPLDVRRLLTSETWIDAVDDPRIGHAAMSLWCESWHQVPAGSLPDNDKVLLRLSMCPTPKEWKRVRESVMRGWVKGPDGRWYHAVVAEKARESWQKKLAQRDRTKAATAAKEKRRAELRAADRARDEQRNVERDVSRDDDRNGQRDVDRDDQREHIRHVHQGTGRVKGQGQGEGQGQGDLKPSKVKTVPAPLSGPPAVNGVGAWLAYANAYENRYSVTPVRNAKVNSQFLQVINRLGPEEAPHVSAFYVRHNRALYVSAKHPVDLLLRDAEGLRTEWAMGRTVTDTEARQADRTQATSNVFQPLIEEARERERLANGSK